MDNEVDKLLTAKDLVKAAITKRSELKTLTEQKNSLIKEIKTDEEIIDNLENVKPGLLWDKNTEQEFVTPVFPNKCTKLSLCEKIIFQLENLN